MEQASRFELESLKGSTQIDLSGLECFSGRSSLLKRNLHILILEHTPNNVNHFLRLIEYQLFYLFYHL